MEKILEGDLSRFEVPDVLTFLHKGGRMGVLVLERPDQETKIFIREGKPIFATSNKEGLRFGEMLVRLGKIPPQDLDRILNRRMAGGNKIGEALLAEKILKPEELATFLKVQVSEVIFETFGWHEGTFTFYDRIPPPATAVTLVMDLQNLIMEGARRVDERARLAEIFPDLNMAVEAVVNPERVKHSVTLTPEEWKVFFLVNGRRSLTEICRLVGDPDEQATLAVLHHLMLAKFLTLVPASEVAAAAAAPVVPMSAAGTQRAGSETRPALATNPVSVEFDAGLPARRPEDDTKEIVNRKAVQYLQNARKVTVSRLILVKEGVETSFPLTRDTYTIGRHRNNDIVITDPKVSSFHARIDRSPDGFVLVDLKSRNGSYVNAKRIETALLHTGDEIHMGTARLLYKVDYTSSVS